MLKNNDFTFSTYRKLLIHALEEDYLLTSFEDYLINIQSKVIILRHDVDKKPNNSLEKAKIESNLGIKSTYYFRIKKNVNKPEIIKNIANLGHEIGYHYEDLANANGDYNKAIFTFEKNLTYFRQFYPVKTICMHGSPLSKWDNRKLWKKFDYRDFGIIGEPYLDIDYNHFFYLSDTGRRWDNYNYSIRDKVNNKEHHDIRSTFDLIDLFKNNQIDKNFIITTHPQRWSNNPISWSVEFISQNTKNLIKYVINRMR